MAYRNITRSGDFDRKFLKKHLKIPQIFEPPLAFYARNFTLFGMKLPLMSLVGSSLGSQVLQKDLRHVRVLLFLFLKQYCLR